MKTWQKVRLGELGEFRNGVNFSKDQKGGNTRLINVKDIFAGERFIDFASLDTVDLKDVANLDRFSAREGDLFFVRSSVKRDGVGLVGVAQTSDADAVHCGFVIRLRLNNPNAEPLFLTYLLRSPTYRKKIIGLSGGSAITNISQDSLGSLQIDFPPFPIQRRIATILSAYDDLIENNARRIKILEGMAQRIYREWFAHFRFPGHEGAKMKNGVPEGWEVKKLGDVIELAYGKGLKADERTGGDIPVYGSAGIVGYHNESLVEGPGIIVGRKGNVGSVFWSDEDFHPIDTVYFVRTDVSLYYAYYNLQGQNFINNDAAVPGLSRNQAYLLDFIVPSSSQTEQFEEIVVPIFGQLRNLRLKNANLRQTRDLLLPKLVSGEVDVSEVEIET